MEYDRIFREEAGPLLAQFGIEAIAHGPSLREDDQHFLLKLYGSMAEREVADERFSSGVTGRAFSADDSPRPIVDPMPAVPNRDDDDARAAPARSTQPTPRAARWTDDESESVAARPLQRHPEPHAPALEGLTTTGASVVGLVGTTLLALIDAVVSPGLGWIFFVGFLAMSAFVGLRLRRRDAWASFGVPPLVFISAAGIAAQIAPVAKGGWLDRTSGDMATAVLDHPFMLLIGTVLAVAAFAYRGLID